MSIATIITRGYGTFGSIGEVVTRGYTSGIVVIPPATPAINFTGKIALDLARPGDIEDPATDRAIAFLHDAVELLSQEVKTLISELNDALIANPLEADHVLHYDTTLERWKNKLVNQLHKLYGLDTRGINQHQDIDISTALETGSVLTYVETADGGSDKFIPLPTFVTSGYGGVNQTGTPSLSDLDGNFQILPANAVLITTPENVTQDHANNGIELDAEGVWAIRVSISLTHNIDAGGRDTGVLVFNQTDAAVASNTITVPIGRSQPATLISLTFLIEVVAADVGDLFQIVIGGGSTVTSVVLKSYEFSATHVSKFMG